LKATFSTTLISRENTVSLANMPAISEEVYTAPASSSDTSNPLTAVTEWMSKLTFGETSEKWKITRFEKTPLVSTYLVAWANGPFEHLESSYTSPLSGKTKKLRIYGTSTTDIYALGLTCGCSDGG
jgi:aminopeptidase 2